MGLSKYLEFKETEGIGNKKVYAVYSKSGDWLGMIEYYPIWRKYCFIIEDIVLSDDCLDYISKFIRGIAK